MSHFRLAVIHYTYQDVDRMLEAYDGHKNQVAINSEVEGDEYYYNPCGRYDYYKLLEEDVPYAVWIEKIAAPAGFLEMAKSIVVTDGRWIEIDDLYSLDAADYFEKISDAMGKNRIKNDIEELYINIYDCHA